MQVLQAHVIGGIPPQSQLTRGRTRGIAAKMKTFSFVGTKWKISHHAAELDTNSVNIL